jgi:hypothetical protein
MHSVFLVKLGVTHDLPASQVDPDMYDTEPDYDFEDDGWDE